MRILKKQLLKESEEEEKSEEKDWRRIRAKRVKLLD
jgi:hypothetical protein